ncbi:ABC transporter permease [Brevibacillus sp. DP1.3A]|uniref:ABC transporter permease n=1 Tax=Brevibacillus sp. DP1.3A TaxID=2738867 RepID=UPI00156AB1D6|nr:ABC transporter permease [Brevibacillus sp. DP1.3A]UED77743.1 ABC transporter permease [Brevibacillus sp. DP1.3A]
MLIKCLGAEWVKLRRSRIWLVLLILPVFSTLIGFANYWMNQAILQNGWYSLWTQVSLFYGEFFLPILIAICCSFVCRLEHANRSWNVILTAPVSTPTIFIAKLVVVGVLLFVVQLFFFVLYICAGFIAGLHAQFSFPPEVFGWIMRGWLASHTIIAFQLWLSTRIQSFAVPVGISICTVFVGLGLYVSGLGMFFPLSLLTIGMGVLSQESLSLGESGTFVVMCVLFVTSGCVLGIRRLTRAGI